MLQHGRLAWCFFERIPRRYGGRRGARSLRGDGAASCRAAGAVRGGPNLPPLPSSCGHFLLSPVGVKITFPSHHLYYYRYYYYYYYNHPYYYYYFYYYYYYFLQSPRFFP